MTSSTKQACVVLLAFLFVATLSSTHAQRRPSDVCRRPSQTGRCRGYFPRFFYNQRSGTCQQFIYGGCGSNGNNFQTVAECERTCGNNGGTGISSSNSACFLPEVTGPCRGSFRRYRFDASSGRCRSFTYGGCRGNGNNFRSMVQCRRSCLLRRG